MRIGFDVSQTAENMAGCGYVADQLIKSLLDIDIKNFYLLYPVFYGYRHPDFKKATCVKKENARFMFQDKSWKKLIPLWNELEEKQDFLGNPDIIHSNNYNCPAGVSAKVVMVIHDMAYLDCPEFTTEANRVICFNGAFEASIYADYIIVPSDFTEERFLYHFPHYPKEKISKIYWGTRQGIKKLSKEESSLSLKKMGIDNSSEFFLGVGTIEPRKNLSLLFEAYVELRKKYKDILPLYIAGGRGWNENSIYKEVKDHGIENKVKFLGYVTDEELSALYSNCYAFIYPSHYEGFGLPLLEAMSCGAPVITSNTSSIPEVCGDSAILINPESKEELCRAMETLLNDRNRREELSSRSIERASMFSWKKTAEKVLEVYEKLMK